MHMHKLKNCCLPLVRQMRETVIHREPCVDATCDTTHVRYMHSATNNTVWTRIRGTPAVFRGGGIVRFISSNVYQKATAQPSWQHIQKRGVNWSRYTAAKASEQQQLQQSQGQLIPVNGSNNYMQDLRRFLEEIGTNPREARYWLKHFQHSSDPYRPFAIVQVDQEVFENGDLMDSLGSALAFLHRNNMNCVVVHGHQVLTQNAVTPEQLQSSRLEIAHDSMMLVSLLESHGAPARPLFSGSHILHAEPVSCFKGHLKKINADPIKWAMSSGHIPILTSIGESSSGQLLTLDLWQVTSQLSKQLQPLKVMCLNTKGGIKDEMGEIVANINIADDLNVIFEKPWCTNDRKTKISEVAKLLHALPAHSSIIITSANQLLTELFTHHGSGTFIRVTESIRVENSLTDVDIARLFTLFNRSFGKDLNENYFRHLDGRFEKLFISDSYNAAAVITKEQGIDVPYLDKFAVSLAKQGEGLSDMLWDTITKDYHTLFWRSKVENKVNPWYFKKCEGSWSNGEWIVFWYGINNHRESIALVEHALQLPSSFGNIITGSDNTLVD